jgi:predicted RNase H-like HicB family nuclease
MDQPVISLTAVYLKDKHDYVGFVEELPVLNSHGKTIDDARNSLRRLAVLVFDEERALSAELLHGKEVVREEFLLSVPRSHRQLG